MAPFLGDELAVPHAGKNWPEFSGLTLVPRGKRQHVNRGDAAQQAAGYVITLRSDSDRETTGWRMAANRKCLS